LPLSGLPPSFDGAKTFLYPPRQAGFERRSAKDLIHSHLSARHILAPNPICNKNFILQIAIRVKNLSVGVPMSRA
jgi:hypothetical protein